MTVTTSLVKQLSLHDGATMRDLRNILMARSSEGTLQEQLLTYWLPVPGSSSHEHAFGYVGNPMEPFVRYVVRSDVAGSSEHPPGYHAFLDLYSPQPRLRSTPLSEAQGFPLSPAAEAELCRQRAVLDGFSEHFTGSPQGWQTSLPLVEYLRRLGVLGHLSIMPLGAVHMLLGQGVRTPFDVTSPEWPEYASEYREQMRLAAGSPRR